MIIWLASYPRSGNTYFRFLAEHLSSIYPLSIYQNHEARGRHEQLKQTANLPEPIDFKELFMNSEKYLVKTHELPQDEQPAIYLVRDGRDALVSYAWFNIQVESSKDDFYSILYRLITTNDSFGGWGSHVLSWTQREATTVVIKFEDLVLSPNPLHVVKQALDKVGYRVSDKLMIDNPPPTFQELQEKYPKIFRKGQIGSWRTEMPPDVHNLFWKRFGAVMQVMDYASK